MLLTPNNVNEIFLDCLFEDGTTEEEALEKGIIVEGITLKIGLDPDKLAKHKDDIISMLNQLPKEFHEKKGGGWSFLNACNRADGSQWTGLHKDMQELMILGMAIRRVKYSLPRDLWGVMSGGMPYFVVTEKEIPDYKLWDKEKKDDKSDREKRSV